MANAIKIDAKISDQRHDRQQGSLGERLGRVTVKPPAKVN